MSCPPHFWHPVSDSPASDLIHCPLCGIVSTERVTFGGLVHDKHGGIPHNPAEG